jgi:hypothetical protein
MIRSRAYGLARASPCANTCSMPADDDQRAILAALLREHPRLVGLPELLTRPSGTSSVPMRPSTTWWPTASL